MKTKNILMAFLAGGLALASCNQTPKVSEGEFLIEGELKNVPDSVEISLLKNDGMMLIPVAKDTVVQGKFIIRDSISGAEVQKLYLLCMADGFPGMWADVWVKSGSYTKITGEDRLLPIWKISSEVPEQQYSNEFLKLCSADRKRSLQWKAQEYDLFRAEKEHGLDWQKVDSLRNLRDPLDCMVYLAEINYLKEAPITKVWLDKYKLYSSFLQWNTKFGHQKQIRLLYDRMSEADKSTELGKEITGYINLPELVNVGEDMVDGDLYDLDGKVRHLSEFKGKYILLDFWSQGCGPCMESLPEMELITQQYKEKMEVVSINQDPKKKWKEFIAKKGLKGNQWNELRKGNTGLAAAYQVRGIPHYVMISPEGKVMAMWTGYRKDLLKEKMEELIK